MPSTEIYIMTILGIIATFCLGVMVGSILKRPIIQEVEQD